MSTKSKLILEVEPDEKRDGKHAVQLEPIIVQSLCLFKFSSSRLNQRDFSKLELKGEVRSHAGGMQ